MCFELEKGFRVDSRLNGGITWKGWVSQTADCLNASKNKEDATEPVHWLFVKLSDIKELLLQKKVCFSLIGSCANISTWFLSYILQSLKCVFRQNANKNKCLIKVWLLCVPLRLFLYLSFKVNVVLQHLCFLMLHRHVEDPPDFQHKKRNNSITQHLLSTRGKYC